MRVAHSLADLQRLLRESFEDESSLSCVFLRGAVNVHNLVTVRNADRLCDITVVTLLEENAITPAYGQYLKEAGADIVFIPREHELQECTVTMGVSGIDGTLIMQVILAVMPMVVSVSPADELLLGCFKRIQQTFPDLFSLVLEETPVHLLSQSHQQMRSALLLVQESVAGGEYAVNSLTQVATKALSGGEVVALKFWNSKAQPCIKDVDVTECYATLAFKQDGQILHDGIKIV